MSGPPSELDGALGKSSAGRRAIAAASISSSAPNRRSRWPLWRLLGMLKAVSSTSSSAMPIGMSSRIGIASRSLKRRRWRPDTRTARRSGKARLVTDALQRDFAYGWSAELGR